MADQNWRDQFREFGSQLRDDLIRAGRHAVVHHESRCYAIDPYRGYGNSRRALIAGRVTECRSIPAASASDSTLRNLLSTWRRIDADPLPFARVRASLCGTEVEVIADDEGFFREMITLDNPLPSNAPWQEATIQLLEPLREEQPDVRVVSRIRVLNENAEYGVISDLDDTVIQSRITNFLQAVRTAMLDNSRTRLPFPGVSEFYQALARGGDGKRDNPIFYVSSSPWNIHDLIADFLDIQRIPEGPICLRDWDFNLSALASNRIQKHKQPLIDEIMGLFPSLKFILIGDSAQKDPEIYSAITRDHPGRILAIYVRNIQRAPERIASVQKLAEEVLAAGSSLILADDTVAAAVHAAENGFISAGALPAIREEKKADEGTTGTKVDAPGVPAQPATPTVVVE